MKLAVVDAKNYQQNEIESSLNSLIDQLGGLEKYVPQGSKVFIKANLIRALPPEKCGTTHPELIRALANRLIRDCSATVTIGDSSGGAYTKASMNKVYSVCGMQEVVAQTKATLNQDFSYGFCQIGGKSLANCNITNSFLSSDVVINFGKLKTHSFTGYTGCVKNLFGLVPGLEKVEVHSKFPNLEDFVDAIIDLERFASSKIVLHFLDAVIGMEGQGPTNGRPKFIGKIIASDNAYLADIAGVSMFEEPLNMPIIYKAIERKVIDREYKNLTDFDFSLLKKDFINDYDTVKVVRENFANLPRWIQKILKNNLCPRVKPNVNICVGCGKCIEHCPAKALSFNKKHKAQINQKKCIRCYCCQELCPKDAIKLKKPLLYRVVRTVAFSNGKK